MFAKPLYVLSFLFLFFSCKKKQEVPVEDVVKQENIQLVTEQDISNLKYIEYALDPKTEEAVQDWAEYEQIEEVIANVKKGDLSFFNDNEKAIQLLLKELRQNIPKPLGSSSIIARILVFETKILKLESLANLSTTTKEELLHTVKELFVSFYTLSFQMNKKVEFDNRTIERP
jgi:hypothetical protein